MKLAPLDLDAVPERWTMAKSAPACDGLWLPFWMHAADTEAVMEYLLRNWVSRAEKRVLRERTDGQMPADALYQVGRFLALMHDVGKVTGEFQAQITQGAPEIAERLEANGLVCRARLGRNTKHALLSQRILLRGCARARGALSIACILGAHHGKPADGDSSGELPYDPMGVWESLEERWIAYALAQSGFQSREDLPLVSVPAQVLWTGLLIMADWIASNPHYFPLIPIEEDGRETNYDRRRRTAVQKLDLTRPWLPEETWDWEQLYRERFGFEANAVQRMVSEAAAEMQEPGIMILEAQMGVGKTEAALAVAEMIAGRTMHSGVYFGLPTQATANGIFGRLSGWAEKQSSQEAHSIRLAHGAAELNEDYQALFRGRSNVKEEEERHGVCVHEWFSGRKQALLADFVVGTVDQLLLAGLKQKHVMLRHLGLANKIVVVDECHAYDAYMNCYLEAALHWLGAYHVPVILLSATLPADRRRDLILAYQNKRFREKNIEPWMKSEAYPLLTWTEGETVYQRDIPSPGPERRVACRPAPWGADDFKALAQDLTEKLRDGGCVGIVVNTVRRAQRCAAILRQYFPEEELRVIHAQYLMPHRAEREKELVKALGKKSKTGEGRPFRLIVVGTQVLEQSLDIDFDYLVTDLCPMDLLLQRIGRLHRHGGRTRPKAFREAACQVLCAADAEIEGGAGVIYGEYLLIRTRELLKGYTELCLPGDISKLVQKTYDEAWDPMPGDERYERAKEKNRSALQGKQDRANVFCMQKPNASKRYPYCYGMLNMSRTEDAAVIGGAEAAVRDGDPSLDVLCMRWGPEEKLYLMDDTEYERPFSPQVMPSAEEAREIARQRLRLPHGLCVRGVIDRIVGQLEEAAEDTVKEWLYSDWLRGELFVLFDEHWDARIGAYRLHYSMENGLETEKEEKE